MRHPWRADLDADRESELVKRMAANDRPALLLLYEAYLPRLVGLFRHVIAAHDVTLVGQLVEQTMLGLWLGRESLAAADCAYESIMRQAVAHARRHLQRQPGVSTAQAHSPLLGMFASLSLDERAVMHFVYTGHSREQVAALMGASSEGVDALLGSARACIKRGFGRRRRFIEAGPTSSCDESG